MQTTIISNGPKEQVSADEKATVKCDGVVRTDELTSVVRSLQLKISRDGPNRAHAMHALGGIMQTFKYSSAYDFRLIANSAVSVVRTALTCDNRCWDEKLVTATLSLLEALCTFDAGGADNGNCVEIARASGVIEHVVPLLASRRRHMVPAFAAAANVLTAMLVGARINVSQMHAVILSSGLTTALKRVLDNTMDLPAVRPPHIGGEKSGTTPLAFSSIVQPVLNVLLTLSSLKNVRLLEELKQFADPLSAIVICTSKHEQYALTRLAATCLLQLYQNSKSPTDTLALCAHCDTVAFKALSSALACRADLQTHCVVAQALACIANKHRAIAAELAADELVITRVAALSTARHDNEWLTHIVPALFTAAGNKDISHIALLAVNQALCGIMIRSNLNLAAELHDKRYIDPREAADNVRRCIKKQRDELKNALCTKHNPVEAQNKRARTDDT